MISIYICRIRIVVGKKIRHYKNADHQEERYLVEKISVQVGTDLHKKRFNWFCFDITEGMYSSIEG